MSKLQKILKQILDEIILNENFEENKYNIVSILTENGYNENEIDYILETIKEVLEKNNSVADHKLRKRFRVISEIEKAKIDKEAYNLLLNYYNYGSINSSQLEMILNHITTSERIINKNEMEKLIDEVAGMNFRVNRQENLIN